MKWSELEFPWQVCFEESWEAYCAGSVSIGAAVFDSKLRLISRARNRSKDLSAPERQIFGTVLAHAELNALISMPNKDIDFHECSIYTALEPCPLCMGAIYMSGIRQVYCAAHDPYAGATDLLGKTPYLSRKPVQAWFTGRGILEDLFLALHHECSLHRYAEYAAGPVAAAWRAYSPHAAAYGDRLFASGWLQQSKQQNQPAQAVFESLSQIIEE